MTDLENKIEIIVNGVNALPGCPKNYEDAHKWTNIANTNKSDNEPQWSFDCGFKLDFDGPLIDISSRFYPPKEHYGATWDGTVHVLLRGQEILKKDFDEKNIEDLKNAVESYISELEKQLVYWATNCTYK